jgi:hypothetical protein
VTVLLHCCCGPCTTAVADYFRSLGHELTGWFCNPNLYPGAEHQRRQAGFERAAETLSLAVLRTGEVWSPTRFLLSLVQSSGSRCAACYRLRLKATAREAAVRGFDAFSTTLLISPYQDLAGIREVGLALGQRLGVGFLFADLRDRYGDCCERARALDLYRQNYCGCLFSDLERSQRRAARAIARAHRRAAA